MDPSNKKRMTLVVLAIVLVIASVSGSCAQPIDELLQIEADELLEAANALYESGSFFEAIDVYWEAAGLYLEAGDLVGYVRCQNGLGQSHRLAGDCAAAMTAFEEALEISQGMELADDERAVTHHGIAECCKERAVTLLTYAWSEAFELLNRAVTHYEEVLQLLPGPSGSTPRGQSLLGLGTCHLLLGDLPAWKMCVEQAATIAPLATVQAEAALGVFLLGMQAETLANYRDAFDCFSQARSFYAVLQDDGLTARSLYHMAYCALHLADYDLSLRLSREALDLYRELPDRAGEAQTLTSIASCLGFLADYETAIATLNEALAIAEAAAGQGDQEAVTAGALFELGICHLHRAEFEEAITSFERSLEIYERVAAATGDWTGVARACVGLAVGLGSQQRPDHERVMALLERGVSIFRETGIVMQEAAAVLMLADTYVRFQWGYLDITSLTEEGIATLTEYYTAALELAEQVGFEEGRWRAYWGLGRVRRWSQDLEGARGYYEQAIEVVEKIRSRIESERLSQSYFASVRSLYEEFLDVLDEMGASDEALMYAERGRARTLLDMIVMGGSDDYDAAYGMSSNGTVDARKVEEITREAPALLQEGEALLVFAWGTERLFTWVVTAVGIGEPVVQMVRQSDVIDRICRFRMSIEGSPVDRLHATDDLVWLYELLVAPVERTLMDFDTWVVVPSGSLWFVPFAALRSSATTAQVVETHSVAYVPSLASLPSLLGGAPNRSGGVSLSLAALTREDDTLPPIPQQQAAELSEAIRSAARTLSPQSHVFDLAASEEAAVRLLEEVSPQYVVFGCHGVFRPDNPLYSYLALMPSAVADPEDGKLEAREVLTMEGFHETELVILMACETFLVSFASQPGTAGADPEREEEERREIVWKLTRGDELIGLSRAFLLAGASAVLATHWQVYVPAATELLPLLVSELAKDQSKAEALRRAQLRLMEIAEYAHDPWKWSAFLLVGNWR
jgi:CHAT domain-containing protein/tetratricopeptide (TPR) repeat protein